MALTSKEKEIVKKLESDVFFTNIPPQYQLYISKFIKLKTYDKNQVIFFPKDETNHVYIVHNGKVRITRSSKKGKFITFYHAIVGDIFGEEGILGKKKYDNYAESMTKSSIWIFPTSDFNRILRESPKLLAYIYKNILSRTIEHQETLADLAFYPLIIRLAKKIVREYKREQQLNITEKGLTITHQELANLLAARRESISACIRTLKKEGLISTKKGVLLIKNINHLESWISMNESRL